MISAFVLLRSTRRSPEPGDVLSGLGPHDFAALRLALTLPNARISVLTMGTRDDDSVLRQAQALGAHRVLRIEDENEGLRSAEQIAPVLAAVFETMPFDLLITGQRSADWGYGILGASLAQRLDIPYLSQVAEVAIQDGDLVAGQNHEDLHVRVTLPLPALISVSSSPLSDDLGQLASNAGASPQSEVELVDIDDLEFTDASFLGSTLPRIAPNGPGTCEMLADANQLLERLGKSKFSF